MPPRRARFTSGQPPPLLPLMSSAGRHYRAARASAAAASSQKPARAPVVRGHTPSRRAPPPPAFRSAPAPPRAAERRRLGERGVPRSGAAALRRCNRAERRRRCARCGALARRGGGRGRSPSAAAGASPGTSGKLRPVPRAALPVPCRPTGRRAAVRGSLRPDARRIFLADGGSGQRARGVVRPVLGGCTFCPSHPAVLAGGAVTQAAMRD